MLSDEIYQLVSESGPLRATSLKAAEKLIVEELGEQHPSRAKLAEAHAALDELRLDGRVEVVRVDGAFLVQIRVSKATQADDLETLTQLHQEIQELRERLARTKADKDAALELAHEYEEQHTSGVRDTAIQTRVDELTADLQASNTEVTHLTSRLAMSNARAARLQRELDAAIQEASLLRIELAKGTSKRLYRQIEDAEEEKTSLARSAVYSMSRLAEVYAAGKDGAVLSCGCKVLGVDSSECLHDHGEELPDVAT